MTLQLQEIKDAGRRISEQFADDHAPSAVNEMVQFTLGFSGTDDAPLDTHPIDVMRMSAHLAAMNYCETPQTAEEVAMELISDERLCYEILEARLRLR